MQKIISKSRFKPRSLEYFRDIEQSGEELVVTDHGRPVLKISPYVAEPEAAFKGLRNTVIRYDDPFEPVGVEEWELLK